MTNSESQKILRILNTLTRHVCTPDSERRNKDRVRFARVGRAILIGIVGQPQVKIITRNLSTGGVGFLAYRAFQIDERFVIPLSMKKGDTKLTLCRVTFVRYLSGAMYEVGVSFEAVTNLNPHSEKITIPNEWINAARVNTHHSAFTAH